MTSDQTISQRNKLRNLRGIVDSVLTLAFERNKGQLRRVDGRKVKSMADELASWVRITASELPQKAKSDADSEENE